MIEGIFLKDIDFPMIIVQSVGYGPVQMIFRVPERMSHETSDISFFYLLLLGFAVGIVFNGLTLTLFLEAVFFDFCGVFFAKVLSVSDIFDLAPELGMDSD